MIIIIQILNRILINCKDKLYKWKIKPNKKCDGCREVVSIDHHLKYCVRNNKFWKELKTWMLDTWALALNSLCVRFCLGSPFTITSKLNLHIF